MIKNKDRSKWFGASDTHYIMGNWNTKTFQNWWMQKLGLIKKEFNTIYTIAGNEYEHKIAETIRTYFDDDKFKLDRQIKCRKWRVRVNLDCESKHTIYEIKTFKKTDKEWKLPENYIMQARVQMLFAKKPCTIVAYPMEEENYKNFFCEIDPKKIEFYHIEQDDKFVKEYLQRVKYLKQCLKKGIMPNKTDYLGLELNYGIQGKSNKCH